MSQSLVREALGRLFGPLSVLSLLWGIVVGCYLIYAGLFGDPLFGLFDGIWWVGFGVLTIFHSDYSHCLPPNVTPGDGVRR
ncbi:MAG: hypothetical protein ABEJ97_04045 [Halobellus sp.]